MTYAELHAHSNFSFLEGVRLRRNLPAGRQGCVLRPDGLPGQGRPRTGARCARLRLGPSGRARELLSLGDRQPLDGHLVFELPEVRVAGDDCAAQALGEGGGEAVRVADTAGRLQTSGGQSQRPVDLVGLDRGLVNEREGLLRRLDSLTIFYGVEHLT